MAFDSTKPADHSLIAAVELRNQFNALQAEITALQQQIAPFCPALNREGGGNWTLSYAGVLPAYWQIWSRSSTNGNWAMTGAGPFPSTDAIVVPSGAAWWQVKVCGDNGSGKQSTLFSNVVAYGPVP